MPKPPSPEQLNATLVLQRITMAWIVFWVVLLVFLGLLGLLIYSIFFTIVEVWVKVGLGLLDGVVGGCMLKIVSYLFPSPSKQTN